MARAYSAPYGGGHKPRGTLTRGQFFAGAGATSAGGFACEGDGMLRSQQGGALFDGVAAGAGAGEGSR